MSKYNECKEQIRMLDGNIARIMMTDDKEEMERMRLWAIKRIEILVKERKKEKGWIE